LNTTLSVNAFEIKEAVLVDIEFIVDNVQVEIRSYLIDDDIYVNIFELALLLRETEKSFFPMMWDSFQRITYIASEQNFNRLGLFSPGRVVDSNSAMLANITVFLSNKEANITNYRLSSGVYSNIFQVAEALDFCIRVSAMDQNINITTSLSNRFSITGRRKIDPDKPMVALTFDDGPVPQTTKLLDILEEYGVVATFYVVGNRIASNRDIMQRMHDMGNEIANHTWSHINMRNYQASTIRSQLLRTNDAIEAITGVTPISMRPPWGEIGSTGRNVAAEFDMYVALWAYDPLDWLTQSADTTYNRIMSNVKDRDILLFHDTVPSTTRAIARIIPALIERDYQFVTVAELMYYSDITPAPGSIVRDGRIR
jgi:peptidoglycan/xylan/chitin deacetylase (PgdA/CDA1 family)